MLRGVDISNWQAGLVPHDLNIEFCICKATEGCHFVDPYCDGFVQDCIANKILWGFYHFARENHPKTEAEFFYNNCTGYIGKGVPVLDYEVWGRNDDVTWCETFLNRFHELSGIWPMLYISASHCSEFIGSWIPERCGLWVAGYPTELQHFPCTDEEGMPIGGTYTAQVPKSEFLKQTVEMPYDISPWAFAAIWQFTSGLILPGYAGSLDGDIAFMDETAWGKYAGFSTKSEEPVEKPEEKTITGRVTIVLD